MDLADYLNQMTQTPRLEDILSLADTALALDGPYDQILLAIAQYSEAFQAWYDLNRENLEQGKLVSSFEQLELLDRKHEEVLRQSKTLMADTKNEMRKLKLKGKGIMAYLDVLPTQISVRHPRRG